MDTKEKTFDLFGSKWVIRYADKILVDNPEEEFLYGTCEPTGRVITVNTKDSDGNKFPENELALSLLHELIHACFLTGQYLPENENEPLVEWLSRCIYSLIKQGIIKKC